MYYVSSTVNIQVAEVINIPNPRTELDTPKQTTIHHSPTVPTLHIPGSYIQLIANSLGSRIKTRLR